MSDAMLRMIMIVTVCLCSGAFAVAGERSRHARPSTHGLTAAPRAMAMPRAAFRAPRWTPSPSRALAADRDPYVDPASPYKANRLSWSPTQPILDIPGQTTVITRQILDDTNATDLGKALGSVAGVTVGR
jgi:outer membrane receptor for monomeric catechols